MCVEQLEVSEHETKTKFSTSLLSIVYFNYQVIIFGSEVLTQLVLWLRGNLNVHLEYNKQLLEKG